MYPDKATLARKIDLVTDLIKNGSIDTITDRAATYAASTILIRDIILIIEHPETSSRDSNFNRNYALQQANSMRSEIEYYLGFSDFTDKAPGQSEHIFTFAHNLKGCL